MPVENRGFASMDRERQREIASKGGRAAHVKGTAHEWTREEARDAGRKGGLAQNRKRREYLGLSVQEVPAATELPTEFATDLVERPDAPPERVD